MLRKFVYNKIFRTTGMLLLLLLLLLFPASKEYNLKDDYSVKTSANIKKREVYLIDKDGYVESCTVVNTEKNLSDNTIDTYTTVFTFTWE